MNPEIVGPLVDLRPAPAFQLYDQESKLVKLAGYLHRHEIVLVFFDGQAGADANANLQMLANAHPQLKSAGVVVFGITSALPQEVKPKAQRDYPFALLSDAAALDARSVHRAWKCLIEPKTLSQPGRTRPAVFLIDRLGNVPWEDGYPRELSDDEIESLVSNLVNG